MNDASSELWNTLKSMKFAIILLILLLIASVFNLFANEFILDASGSESQIKMAYTSYHGKMKADILMFFQMYKPYRSWWYTALLTLTTISLTVCIIDRAPRIYNNIFHPKFFTKPSNFENRQHFAKLTGGKGTLEAVARVLENNRYRVRMKDNGSTRMLVGDRFALSRSGSWVVHIGFLLLVVGGAMIARGEHRDRAGGFPGELLADSEEIWGFNVRVDDFTVEYYPLAEGQLVEVDKRIIGKIIEELPENRFKIETYRPNQGILKGVEAERISNRIDTRVGDGGRLDMSNISDYISMLTIIENGKELSTHRIEVNAPLRYKGYRFYQTSFNDQRSDANGKWTTILEVRKDKGSPFIWVGIILFSIGSIVSSYFTPRRIQALSINVDNEEQVFISGKVSRNESLFGNEFKRLIKDIRS